MAQWLMPSSAILRVSWTCSGITEGLSLMCLPGERGRKEVRPYSRIRLSIRRIGPRCAAVDSIAPGFAWSSSSRVSVAARLT